MAIKLHLMGTGFSAGQSGALTGPGDTSITAAGSSSTDATTIGSHHNAVGTTAASTGVIFAASKFSAGDQAYVYNGGASTLTIYPPSGSTIDNTTSATIATLKGIWFVWGTDTKIVSHKST